MKTFYLVVIIILLTPVVLLAQGTGATLEVQSVQTSPSQTKILIPTETRGIEHEDIGLTSEIETRGIEKEDLGVTAPNIDTEEAKQESGERLLLPDLGVTSGAIYIKYDDIEGESVASTKKPKEIVVVGSKVRGWDPKTKEEIKKAAPKDVNSVQTAEDLALFIAITTENDTAVENVTLNFEKIKVDYKSQGKFLGFIPISYKISAIADVDGGRVKVKFPWYRFLLKSGMSAKTLETEIQTSLAAEVGLLSAEAQIAQTFRTVSSVLKTKHDTAKNSIQNVR